MLHISNFWKSEISTVDFSTIRFWKRRIWVIGAHSIGPFDSLPMVSPLALDLHIPFTSYRF